MQSPQRTQPTRISPLTPEDPESHFIESMGLSAEADGLPRIAGRMWGFFILHDAPCSFGELAKRLQVSRGSISTNARILRDLGILERVSLPGDRQDYYRLADHPYDRLLLGYIERMRQTGKLAERTQQALPATQQPAQQRLAEMRRFYQSAIIATEELVESLKAELTALPQAADGADEAQADKAQKESE